MTVPARIATGEAGLREISRYAVECAIALADLLARARVTPGASRNWRCVRATTRGRAACRTHLSAGRRLLPARRWRVNPPLMLAGSKPGSCEAWRRRDPPHRRGARVRDAVGAENASHRLTPCQPMHTPRVLASASLAPSRACRQVLADSTARPTQCGTARAQQQRRRCEQFTALAHVA